MNPRRIIWWLLLHWVPWAASVVCAAFASGYLLVHGTTAMVTAMLGLWLHLAYALVLSLNDPRSGLR